MGFRADLIVEDNVIVEIKSVEAIAPVHKKQLLTHLRLADKRLGVAHQLQRCADQRRHHPHRKRHAGLISRKRRQGAKRSSLISDIPDYLRETNTPRRSEAEPR